MPTSYAAISSARCRACFSRGSVIGASNSSSALRLGKPAILADARQATPGDGTPPEFRPPSLPPRGMNACVSDVIADSESK
jgi:hypothetical protein